MSLFAPLLSATTHLETCYSLRMIYPIPKQNMDYLLLYILASCTAVLLFERENIFPVKHSYRDVIGHFVVV